jgi:hypothetical protein
MQLKTDSPSLDQVSYSMVFFLIAQLVIFAWCINRGFDFSDEAYGYLGFTGPSEVRGGLTHYAVLYNFFFGWLGISIVKVRTVRFLLLIGCSVVFAFGLNDWLKRKTFMSNAQRLNLFLIVLIGACHINTNGSQSLTYNLSSTYLLLLIAGLWLFSFQLGKEVSRLHWVVFFALGLLLFSLFIVKFSSAVLMGVVLIVLLVVDKPNIKIIAISILMIVVGAVTMAILLFGLDFANWISEYCKGIFHSTNSFAPSFIDEYKEDFRRVKNNLIVKNIIWIGLFSSGLAVSRMVVNRIFSIIVAIIVAAGMTYLSYVNSSYFGGLIENYYVNYYYYILWAVVLGLAEIIVVSKNILSRKEIDRRFPMAIFLFAVPFFGAIGTSNFLSIQILWYSPLFFAALYLLLKTYNNFIFGLLLTAIVANATVQSVSGLIYFPYRVKGTLWLQDSPLTNANESVLLDAELKGAVDKMRDLVYTKTKFVESGPVFSFRSEYGFVYFLKGTLPGWGWYKDEAPSEQTCLVLKRSKLSNLNQTILLIPKEYKVDSSFQACLNNISIDFPKNYESIGDVPFAFNGTLRTLEILVPKPLLK